MLYSLPADVKKYLEMHKSSLPMIDLTYMKTIFRDLWGVFEAFALETITCGYETTDYDRRTLQLNWKDMNNYLKLVDEVNFFDYLSKIQCFRMDRFGEVCDHNKNAILYSEADVKLNLYLQAVYGKFEGFEVLRNYFADMGLNVVPLNNLCHFDYDEINHKSKPSVVINSFAEKGFDISLSTARNIQTFLCGVWSNSAFSNNRAIGFKKVCLGRDIIPELLGYNSHSVSFCLSAISDNDRQIPKTTKRYVMAKYGEHSIDHGIGEFWKQEPVAAEYARLLSISRFCADRDYSKELDELSDKVKWKSVFTNFGVTLEDGYRCHHIIFKSVLQNKGPDWLCCDNECFLVPINKYEHKILHSGGKDEMETLEYLIDKKFMSYFDVIEKLNNMLNYIDDSAPPGAYDHHKIVGHIKKQKTHLLRKYGNVKIPCNS